MPEARWRFLAATVLGLCLGLLALSGALDRSGGHYLEQSLQRSLVAFATARALNGVISVAQGTELALEPAGVGLNFSPGEILDPINDLIERFSWVMLAASSSLGVQKVMLAVGAWWPVTALLLLCVGAGLWGMWYGHWQRTWFRRVLGRLLLFSLVLRFAVPVLSLSTELLYRQFLAPQYQQASEQLDATRAEVDLLNQSLQPDAQVPSFWSRVGGWANELGGWREKLGHYEQAAERASRSTLDLIVVFVFQTLLVPLVFAWWLCLWLAGWFRRLD